MTEFENPPVDPPVSSDRTTSEYAKGDLLHPEWAEPPSWFGYIGVGIAIVAMLIGIGGMVLGIRFLMGWFAQ
jgi:hypothetical protein